MCNPESTRLSGRLRAHPLGHASRGVSLIELLVGLTLGLLVILAAIGTLMISRGASASVSEISQLQQQASYALRTMGLQLRQAGAIDATMNADTKLFSFATSYAGYGSTSAAIYGTDSADGSKLYTSTTRAPMLPESQNHDCIGNTVAADKIEATFWLVNGELKCAPTSTTSEALIKNVADFQVRYRVLNGINSQVLSASQVEASGLWAAVKAVEVCLDMQGTEKTPDAGTSYTDCKGKPKARDGFLHLVYRNVFDLRVAGGG